VPQAGLFQEVDAIFEPGRSYTLTVGAIGGGGGMPPGATLLASLYYMDGTNMATVAAAPVVFSTNQFPTTSILVDVSAQTAPVKASEPWAGKKIGAMFMAISGQEFTGGYWDLDNVRLTADGAAAAGVSLTVAREGANVRVSWPAENGKSYQLQVSQDLRTWSDRNAVVAGTGAIVSQVLPLNEFANGFFRVAETQ
jgi:hypothetical protein